MNTNVNLSAAVGALATEGGVGMPLDTPLRPGESYTTEPVFDIGHENSPRHGQTEFGL